MENINVIDGLVSIIMPSWNTAKFIAETIQSVIDQTYQNWELLIVDDCSTDNTDEIVASFKDDRIKYFHNEKNSGAALTRNRAMREAQGEWIAFLDSDDLWMPKKLEKQIAQLKAKMKKEKQLGRQMELRREIIRLEKCYEEDANNAYQ